MLATRSPILSETLRLVIHGQLLQPQLEALIGVA
ncbi:hypothetical protein SAMN04489747_0957 [Auraticoccus monumenti]|uniref:Uncharacterized protein n=1 Tax=Auraticoccus monumenti TaxID=675864 RepID=A0A1G6US88_9ACTN|nr:hypothetical protein SAMN04489747_0957 [Auraticoccus monumenti]